MGLMEEQNVIGDAIEAKREANKAAKEAEEKAAEDTKKELAQHEENKKQGML